MFIKHIIEEFFNRGRDMAPTWWGAAVLGTVARLQNNRGHDLADREWY